MENNQTNTTNRKPTFVKIWFIIPVVLFSFALGMSKANLDERGWNIGHKYGYIQGQHDFAIEITDKIGLTLEGKNFDKTKFKPYRQVMGVYLYIYQGEKFKSFAIKN